MTTKQPKATKNPKEKKVNKNAGEKKKVGFGAKTTKPVQSKVKPASQKVQKVEKKKPASKAQKARIELVKVKARALRARKAVLRTLKPSKSSKVRYSATFRRPKTHRAERNPKYPRHILPAVPKFDMFSVIKHPLTSESCMKKLEDLNTLTFIVNSKANKHSIRKAVKTRYDVVAQKVTTLNLPNGEKKAYVRLTSDVDAIEVANRVGMV